MFFLTFLLILPLLFLVLLAALKGENKKTQNTQVSLSDCTLIVPFRNEGPNLKRILKSLKEQKVQPSNVIFVNDHSTDDWHAMFDRELMGFPHWKLHHALGQGKKNAISEAVELAQTEYCITMDADVSFSENYFSQCVFAADLIILPVKMKAKGFFGTFAAIEYNLFNALNFLLGRMYILSCSGANLMFRVSCYEEIKHEINQFNHASGDDYFLLRGMQKRKKKIIFSLNRATQVTTHGTETFSTYFQQRLRWIGKTGGPNDLIAQVIGIFIALYFLGAAVGIPLFLWHGEWLLFFAFITICFMFELVVFLPYQFRLNNKTPILNFFVFTLIYPFLFYLLLITSIFVRPKWKGRELTSYVR